MPEAEHRCPRCGAENPPVNRFCAKCGAPFAATSGAAGTAKAPMQWKWVMIGAVVVVAFQFVAGFVMAIVAPEAAAGLVSDDPSGAALATMLAVMFVGYFAAGLVVALLSPGLTLREPAVGAAVAVVISNLTSGGAVSVLFSWIIPFGLTLLGARLGERLQKR